MIANSIPQMIPFIIPISFGLSSSFIYKKLSDNQAIILLWSAQHSLYHFISSTPIVGTLFILALYILRMFLIPSLQRSTLHIQSTAYITPLLKEKKITFFTMKNSQEFPVFGVYTKNIEHNALKEILIDHQTSFQDTSLILAETATLLTKDYLLYVNRNKGKSFPISRGSENKNFNIPFQNYQFIMDLDKYISNNPSFLKPISSKDTLASLSTLFLLKKYFNKTSNSQKNSELSQSLFYPITRILFGIVPAILVITSHLSRIPSKILNYKIIALLTILQVLAFLFLLYNDNWRITVPLLIIFLCFSGIYCLYYLYTYDKINLRTL